MEPEIPRLSVLSFQPFDGLFSNRYCSSESASEGVSDDSGRTLANGNSGVDSEGDKHAVITEQASK